jgi:Flp pilus assembly pilin Flp
VPTFSDLFDLVRAAGLREEGQTMAEYGVTLAVITVALLAMFTALSGGISGAVNRAAVLLPS